MRFGRIALTWAIGVVAAVGIADAAWADTKECKLNDRTGRLECALIASPSRPVEVRFSQELPIVWRRYVYDRAGDLPTDPVCVRMNAGIREIAVIWVVALVNVDTDETLDIRTVCEWPGEDPPDPPPPPPTPAQLATDHAQTLTLQPVLSPSSSIGGLTGLESWLWCDDPGAVPAGVELNGWVAEGSVEVVQLGWEVDGPSGTVVNTPTCGSEEAPAVTWTPETMGDYSIVITTVWAGTWTLTWNGVPMGTYPLGPLPLTAAAAPYPVDEYRGELTG